MNINIVLPAITVMEENFFGSSQFRIMVLEEYSFKNKKRKKRWRSEKNCWLGSSWTVGTGYVLWSHPPSVNTGSCDSCISRAGLSIKRNGVRREGK